MSGLRRRVLAALVAGLLVPAAGLGTAAAQAAMAGPAAGTAGSAGSPGSVGIRLDGVSGVQRTSPRDKAYIVRYVRRGATVRARLSISNASHAVQRVTLYAGSASVRKGVFTFGAGTTPNELTTWTHLSSPLLVLRPGTLRQITARIMVPRHVPSGPRYGVIWAQVTGRGKGQVTEVNRVGVRMYITVGHGGPPPAGFAITSLTATHPAGGPPEAVAEVRNTGGVPLDLTGKLRLTGGPGGVTTGPMNLSSAVTLAPGTTTAVKVAIRSGLPAGPWHAVLTLHGDRLTRTARATLTFPPPPKPQTHDGPAWLLTAGLIAIAVVLALALIIAARQRRKTRRANRTSHRREPPRTGGSRRVRVH